MGDGVYLEYGHYLVTYSKPHSGVTVAWTPTLLLGTGISHLTGNPEPRRKVPDRGKDRQRLWGQDTPEKETL